MNAVNINSEVTLLTAPEARLPLAPSGRTSSDPKSPSFAGVFEGALREHGYEPLRIEGRVPHELDGTLYRNGPASFEPRRSVHVFDGNGAIVAVRFGQGAAEGAVRFVHTPTADEDMGNAKARYATWGEPASFVQFVKGLFGAPMVRNNSAINVQAWRGRLFAMSEVALPVEIDPVTLATLGETDLDGLIQGAWNAHPHYVPARRTTYQFGVRIEPGLRPRAWIDLYALPDEASPTRLSSIALPEFMEVHDFFVTENHVIFALVPVAASWEDLLRHRGAVGTALKWRPERGTPLLVVPIDAPSEVIRIDTEAFFFWHSVNAFEADSGRTLTLDLIRFPDYPTQAQWIIDSTNMRDGARHTGRYCRARIDLTRKRVAWETFDSPVVEFPMVHPRVAARSHRFAWMAGFTPEAGGRGLLDCLVRFDVSRGEALTLHPGLRGVVSEPILVPKRDASDEEAVWVLAPILDVDRDRAHVAIWDGERPEDGPIARAWFDERLGPTFHGTWQPAQRRTS